MEKVRAEHVPPKAPAAIVAFAEHVHGARADLVDAADIPAEVMRAGRIGAREGDHVMIAAVNAVQKGDVVSGVVGEAQSDDARIEFDRLRNVGREHEDMREAARIGALHRAAERGPALAGPRGDRPRICFSRSARFSA